MTRRPWVVWLAATVAVVVAGLVTLGLVSHSQSHSRSGSDGASSGPGVPGNQSTQPDGRPRASIGDVGAPVRAAFYYGWFPEAENWASQFTPLAGKYDSSDRAVVAAQVAQAKAAHLDAFISSWWGRGTKTDSRLPLLLDTAKRLGFHDAAYYEPEGFGNPTAKTVSADLTYLSTIAGRYGDTWLRVGGKPVLFVYNANDTTCAVADKWAAANAGRFYLSLKIFPGYTACRNQPDSWHQYGAALSISRVRGYSITVSAGFWKFSEAAPRLVRDVARFRAALAAQVASGVRWQLLTTWNEWGEGTGVEPTREFGAAYLDAMASVYPGAR